MDFVVAGPDPPATAGGTVPSDHGARFSRLAVAAIICHLIMMSAVQYRLR
jgi:hypothetical protein